MKYFTFTLTHDNGDVFTQTLRLTQKDANAMAAIMRSDRGMKSVTVEQGSKVTIIARIRRQKAARMVQAEKALAFAKAAWSFATHDPDSDCTGDAYVALVEAWLAAVKAWQDADQNSMARYFLT